MFPVVVFVRSRETTEVSSAFPDPIPLAAVISRILPVTSVAPPSITDPAEVVRVIVLGGCRIRYRKLQ